MSKKSHLKSSKSAANSTIRIIGGNWRSRKLPVINANGLRPTTDKVRETLFNWLAPYLHGATVLDAFAGTGALGLESLSRGAKQATFVELNSQAAQQLKANILTLKCMHANVHHKNTLAFLDEKPTAFDIIFVDPPFSDDLWPQALQKLTGGWLAKNAVLYIETPADYALTLPHDTTHNTQQWRILKEKKSGQVRSMLVQFEG